MCISVNELPMSNQSQPFYIIAGSSVLFDQLQNIKDCKILCLIDIEFVIDVVIFSSSPKLIYVYSTTSFPDNEVVAHLPLQMLMYFNMYFFPFWWTSEMVMLELKVSEWLIIWSIWDWLMAVRLDLTFIQLSFNLISASQFSLLPAYYQCLLVTGVVLLTIFEIMRIYLGYVGNLEEKVSVNYEYIQLRTYTAAWVACVVIFTAPKHMC